MSLRRLGRRRPAGMARVARARGDGEGVAGDGVAIHRGLRLIAGAGQVTINAADPSLAVNAVRHILRVIFMAGGAQGIGRGGDAGTLGVDLVAIDAGDAHLAVAAGRPLLQRIGMARAAQFL